MPAKRPETFPLAAMIALALALCLVALPLLPFIVIALVKALST
jgi:hypothetical protein